MYRRKEEPDEEGTFLEKKCGLAHVRLSIIDLERGETAHDEKGRGKNLHYLLITEKSIT